MALESTRICVVGSSNIDITFRLPRFPLPGETLTAGGFTFGFGGKGANQAVMAARLGASVSLISKLGGQAFSAESLEHYKAEGLETRFVVVDRQQATGTAAILVDSAARNCIVLSPNANAALSPEDVAAGAEAIRSARFVLCQLEVPVDANATAFRIARAAGVGTILNPAPAEPLPEALLALTDVCIPNEHELAQITERPSGGDEDTLEAARSLLARGPKCVLVTMGEKGCLLATEAKSEHLPAIQVEAVDTSGAGDAFVGSLAVFLAEGRPFREAVCCAQAAAALSVTRSGTQASFPNRDELTAFLRKRGGLTSPA